MCSNQALDHIPETSDLFRKTLRRLQSTCSHHRVLPQSHLIPNKAFLERGGALASGTIAKAREAELGGRRVRIETLSSYVHDIHDEMNNVCLFLLVSTSKRLLKQPNRQAFYKEVIVWKRLQHPNIVPLLRVPTKIPPFEIICEWMEDGTITEYIRRHPTIDLLELVSRLTSTATILFER